MKRINLAILSPSFNAYSETFIQAHKELIQANTHYYYGGDTPIFLDGKIRITNIFNRLKNKIRGKIKQDPLYEARQNLQDSFKENKIEVVLAEYGPTGMNVLPVCKALNLPLIVHFHGYDASREKVIKDYDNYLAIYDYASYIVAVSKVMQTKLQALGCPSEKLILNTYGPNDSFLQITPSSDQKQLVGIGRFVDKKAPYYTILAFKEVVKAHPNAQLILGGNGPLWNTCQNLIKYWELQDNIKLPGILKPVEYQKLLESSRAFVQHSITAEDGDMEGTPLAVLEAAAASVPVISTYHAGIPDVIIHQETGLLCQEHDVDMMAKHMKQLLSDKSYAMSLGKKSRQRVQENFSMDNHIHTLNQLIQQSIRVR